MHKMDNFKSQLGQDDKIDHILFCVDRPNLKGIYSNVNKWFERERGA